MPNTSMPDSTTPAVDSYRCLARGRGLGRAKSFVDQIGGGIEVFDVVVGFVGLDLMDEDALRREMRDGACLDV